MMHTPIVISVSVAMVICLSSMVNCSNSGPGILVGTNKEPINLVSSGSTPTLCEPGIIDDMPPHIKKVCLALENTTQLSNALNAYIRNEAASILYKGEEMLAGGSTIGKRTDVDHVFLRFGRRR